MSEIWTPGDGPSDDKPSGGIELPKGFATRRRQREEQKQQEETEPTEGQAAPEEIARAAEQVAAAAAPGVQPQVAAPDAAAARGRGDFLFPPAAVQVQCPNCGTPFRAPVFSIIDLGANPELRQALLGGQINMAICPNCGAGGTLSAPLMVHDPEHKYLAVLIPQQAQLKDDQAQKVIGEMSKALMDKLPSEQRKGYMLQPRQFFNWDNFLEKFWEFEGVSAEELRRQREQSELVSSLMRLADDEKAMRLMVERKKHLVDEGFFALLGQVMQAFAAQGQEDSLENLRALRQHLLETTEAGSKVKELEDQLRQALERLKPQMSRDEILDVLLDYWRPGSDGERIVATLLSLTPGLTDYQFLMTLSGRIDQARDEEERADLMALRDLVVSMNEQQSRSQQAMLQQAQSVLQEVLQAPDPKAKLQEHADAIDELFLTLLSANIQQAEEKGASFAAKRLRSVYEAAIDILEENMPEDMRLLNQLLTASDEATVRSLLKENRELLSQEFVQALSSLEQRARSEGSDEMASRIKRLRGQVSLML